MIPVLSRAQMRAYDRVAIEGLNVPDVVLMENAGRGAAEVVERIARGRGERFVVVAGPGNNGGDGLVVARHLVARGATVRVVLVGSPEKLAGAARANLDAFVALRGRLDAIATEAELPRLDEALAASTLAIDALFGTGLDRPLRGLFEAIARRVDAAPLSRVALDVPSGLDADAGTPLGFAIRADDTVTFGHLKPGLLAHEGARLAGRVHVVGLGVPDTTILAEVGRVADVVEDADVRAWLAPRGSDAHKHRAGNVLVLAGSPGRPGAALLAARGALRAGAGLVTLGAWPGVAAALEARVVEEMTTRIEPTRLLASLDAILAGRRVVAIGPGFGLDDAARAATEHVVLGWEGPKVVDADAIGVFAGRADALTQARGSLVLTPHAGELARLLGTTSDAVERDRFGAAREAAARTGAVVLLKGARTLVCTPEGKVTINATGNAALATAGSGDVLTGVVAALACTLPLERAGAAAAHLHGRSADAWRAATGADRGMLAREIADGLPRALAGLAKPGDALPV